MNNFSGMRFEVLFLFVFVSFLDIPLLCIVNIIAIVIIIALVVTIIILV